MESLITLTCVFSPPQWQSWLHVCSILPFSFLGPGKTLFILQDVFGSHCAIDPVSAWLYMDGQGNADIWEAVQHIASIYLKRLTFHCLILVSDLKSS